MKIRTRLLTLILVLLLAGGAVGIVLVNQYMRRSALSDAKARALAILNRQLAIHTYFTKQLKPGVFELADPILSKDYFDPVWMSSTYAIREIEKHSKAHPDRGLYKECATNARNPENEADDHERAFLQKLKKNPQLKVESGIRSLGGEEYLVVLQRGESMEEACLRCHGRPDQAPAGLVRLYGEERGFQRSLGEVAQAISIRVPLSAAFESADRLSVRLSAGLVTLLGALLAALYLFSSRWMLRPLDSLREGVLEIVGHSERLGDQLPMTGGREINELTVSFNRMSARLRESRDHLEESVRRRTAELDNAIQNLKGEIEERKRAAEALRESELRYRGIFDNSPIGIELYDPEGRLIQANAACLEMFGVVDAGEIRGFRLFEDPNVPPKSKEALLRGEPVRYQAPFDFGAVRAHRLYGTSREGFLHIDVLITPLRPAGTAEGAGYMAQVQDITERKKAEEALRESEARFRELAELLPQVVFETDDQGVLTYANRYAFEVFGYQKEDLEKGLTVLQTMAPEDRERVARDIRTLLTGNPQTFGGEYRCLRKDGISFPATIYSSPIVKESATVGMRGILIDMSERKRAEQEREELQSRLAQAQKMEAVGTLAGGIAHDFNNILAGIIGYAELALMKETPDRDPRQHGYLSRVIEAGLRAKELVEQILKFSRGTDTTFAAISLEPIIKESVKLLHSTLPKNIEIRQRIGTGQQKVLGNPTQVHQVIMNLCTNAYHAMRDRGGILEVGLEKVRLDRDREFLSLKVPPGDYMRLSVSDTGHGMAPEVLERIFEPYFTTKKPSEGTGLGLSVTLGIAKSHHGLIQVESELGKGTRFDVYLPVAWADPPPARTLAAGAAPVGNGEMVLVVDDEHFFLDVLQENLESIGYRVKATQSSLKALEIFRTSDEGFGLVITDQSMPEMTGVQLIAEIRKYDPEIPVILCTGYSETVSERSAEHYGITKLLMKPVTAGDLARAVRETIDRNKGNPNGTCDHHR